jgi:hypothetical protein
MAPPKFSRAKASYHLQETLALTQLISDQCVEGTGTAPARYVLAGDWNAEPRELDALIVESEVTGLSRIGLPADASTGLSADFSRAEAIDHVRLREI